MNKSFYAHFYRNFILLFVPILLLNLKTTAQLFPITPQGIMDSVVDRKGNKYHLINIAVSDTIRGYDTLVINKELSCSSGYFRVFVEPGCGLYSDTATADTARRNVLCRVLHDLSQFIHSPLTTSGGKINVWVRYRGNVPGASGAVGYGTSFYNAPAIPAISGIADNMAWLTIHSGTDGYKNVSNINPMLLTSTGATFFHIILTFDFDTYTWHTNLTTAPSGGEYDLYTVAIRELARSLGLVSEINGNGTSLLGANYHYYSRYDKFLKTHSGLPLIINGGSYPMYNYIFDTAINVPANVLSPNTSLCVTDSTNCDTAVKYDGSVTVPVYTPNCYQLGHSLSSFEDQCTGTPDPTNNNLYFTASNVTNIGSMKRYLKPEERSALCDIGYATDTVYGDTTYLNYYHYGSSVCTGITVAGVNDGLDVNGNIIYFSSTDRKVRINGTSLASSIPGLLANDVNADAFEGLEVLIGSGTLNATSGNSSTDIYYTPASGEHGVLLIRYTPVNTTSGKRGNITYAEMLVSLEGCLTDTCNLVVNGNFEEINDCGVIDVPNWNHPYGSTSGYVVPSHICNWAAYANSADLFHDGCTGLTIYECTTCAPDVPYRGGSWYTLDPVFDRYGDSTHNFIGLNGGRRTSAFSCPSPGEGWFSEALKTQLAAPLIPGGKYVLDFWARVGKNTITGATSYPHRDGVIQFHVSTLDPVFPVYYPSLPPCGPSIRQVRWEPTWLGLPFPTLTGDPSGFAIPDDAPAPGTWYHIVQPFTYTGPAAVPGAAQFLIVNNDPRRTALLDYPTHDTTFIFDNYIFIEDVRIKPVIQTYPPITVCPGDSFMLHPDSLVMATSYTSPADTFMWSPATGLSCTTCASPTGAIGTTTVYTVTESLYQCSRYDTVKLHTPPNAVATADTPCSNGTLHLNATASTGYGTLSSLWIGPPIGTFIATGAIATRTPPVAGVYTLVVTDSHGCHDTTTVTVTVNPTPGAIAGVGVLCVGQTTTWTNPVTGGTWVSSNPSVATIGVTTGFVTALSAGTTIITYGFGTACIVTKVLTVNPVPAPITGVLDVCVGLTTTLSDATPGGTWESSNTAVGTVGSTGIVAGISAGTTNITYTLSTGCYTYTTVTVHPVPTPISGTLWVCTGNTRLLSSTPTGGTWSSTTPAIATIGSLTGIVSGITPGTTTISYSTAAGCDVWAVFTVYPTPASIGGTTELCVGATTTLTDADAGGTWSSSNTAVGTIGSTGIVTGISAGTTTITYTLGFCYTTIVVTVDGNPTILGGAVCTGSTLSLLASATPPGGTWVSGTTTVATIGSSTGLVTGVTPGTTIITYILGTGCSTTAVVTVNETPPAITGTLAVCVGLTTTLSNTLPGGTWSSIILPVATIGSSSGVVIGVSAGISVISYVMPTGCGTAAVVTVNPLPVISGDSFICVLDVTTMASTIPGGTWSSSTPPVATVGSSSGVVTGVVAGTTIITYTTPVGCIGTDIVTVNPLPTPIIGDTTICWEHTTTLTDTSLGGTWSVGMPPEIYTTDSISILGFDTGVIPVTYTLPTGCSTTTHVHVYPAPVLTSGTMLLCGIGTTTTLVITPAGGTWSSSSPTVATIGSSSGFVTGLSYGMTLISYTSAEGCYWVGYLYVLEPPAPIAPTVLCVDGTATMTCTPTGGIWSSGADTLIARFYTYGVLTGLSAGTALITYTLYYSLTPTSSGCSVTTVATVNTTPFVPPITGFDTLCLGTADTLFDVLTGGFWTSSNPSVVSLVATPPIVGSSGQIVVGVSLGTALISYTVSNTCGSTTVTKLIRVIGVPGVPVISGVLGVCSGYTDTLHGTPAGGTWASSNPAIASISPLTGVVTGIVGGTVTITYSVTNLCGTRIATTNVLVNMEPYITANFLVACQTLSGTSSESPSPVISSSSTCILTCDSSIIRYYAHGVAGSAFTWDIGGGTVIADYGDSIDVLWTTVGLIGSIVVHDTFHHCIDSARACIKVIDKPDAYFTTPASHYCLGTNVLFTDYSTGDPISPIVYWHWNFGDGSSSSAPGSSEHAYTTAGTYTVTLTVRNACNCTDSFKVVIEIDRYTGPNIYCPAIVCDSSYYTYSTSAICGTYIWTVTGGTIVSGAGTSSIKVKWDMADASGFGYVELFTPLCGRCVEPTTIKVPIILQSPEITGEDIICTGIQYTYSLPLWPATDYMWGVLGDPGAVMDCHTSHDVVVSFTTPGTYTLHGWYQNRITLCGGNVFKTITVSSPSSILGNTPICAGSTETYSLSGSFSADWELVSPTGSVLITTSGSTTFTNTFSTPGMYMLTATGAFCADPRTITVMPLPAAADSITGMDTVCLGRPYSYKAWGSVPGTIFRWTAIGGDVSPDEGTNIVTVNWADTGTKQLKVRRVSTLPPYCEGPQITLNIRNEVINPNVTGDTLPCVNSYRSYSSNYYRGEDYEWRIIPNTAGSVTSGLHSPDMTVLWNNFTVPTSADIVIFVRKCDSTKTDTLHVTLAIGAPIAILSVDPNPACPLTMVTVDATPGGTSYVWDWGDGVINGTSTETGLHAYPYNDDTVAHTYTISVTSGGGACPLTGIGTATVSLSPGPHVYVTCMPTTFPACMSATLTATATTNAGSISYAWYDGTTGPISTASTYVAASSGDYYCVITASNGCGAVSNTIPAEISPCPDDSTVDASGPCPLPTSITHNCGTLTLTAPGATSGSWAALYTPLEGPFSSGFTTVYATYQYVGQYWFTFNGTTAGYSCLKHVSGTVYVIPGFEWRAKCGTGGNDTIFVYDRTDTYSGVTGITRVWNNVSTATGFGTGGTNEYVVVPAGAAYNIQLTFICMTPDGPETCAVNHTVTLPAMPSVTFTYSVSPICERVPISFTPSVLVGSITDYLWLFGDGSSLALPFARREYTYGPGSSFPSLQSFNVSLIARDAFGCADTSIQTVQIQQNALNGYLGDDLVLCSNAVPVTLVYNPLGTSTPTSYLWSTGETTSTISVSESGAYWVTVRDVWQCQKTRPDPNALKVTVVEIPNAEIRGPRHYCYGDVVTLNGFAGYDVGYKWYRNGVALTAGYTDAPERNDPSLDTGTYYYQLRIRVIDTATNDTCYDVSAIDTIHMYPLPDPPTITGPVALNCGLYLLQLIASEPVSGTYNWVGGPAGPVYVIDRGGPFRVWFTDLHGCVSHRDVLVPLAPNTYFPYFPKGCYNICTEQLPLVLNGPPCVSFDHWAWLKDTVVVDSSTSSVPTPMAPYAITGNGMYQWVLDNGLCTDTSEAMNLETVNCNKCQGVGLAATLVCDTTNPASYYITISFNTYTPGMHYVLGTDIGPITPFSGTLTGTGLFTTDPITTFTTLVPTALPDSITVRLILTYPDGSKCYDTVTIALDTCYWTAERGVITPHISHTHTQPITSPSGRTGGVSTLLVFPNPASGYVTISYDYGTQGSDNRHLAVYDVMGRRTAQTAPEHDKGLWKVDINTWAAGMYIIRMEGDGVPLQTARVIITH